MSILAFEASLFQSITFSKRLELKVVTFLQKTSVESHLGRLLQMINAEMHIFVQIYNCVKQTQRVLYDKSDVIFVLKKRRNL